MTEWTSPRNAYVWKLCYFFYLTALVVESFLPLTMMATSSLLPDAEEEEEEEDVGEELPLF